MCLLNKYRELKLRRSIVKVCQKADRLIPVNASSKPKIYTYRPDYEQEGLMSIVCGVMGYLRYCQENNILMLVDMKTKKNSYLSKEEVGKINAWEYFYQQPMNIKLKLEDVLNGPHYENPERTVHGLYYDRYIAERINLSKYKPKIRFPQQNDYLYAQENLKQDCELYKNYFSLSYNAKKYIESEYIDILPKTGKVLGVVCRGTDYVQLKPYNHNIQPAPGEILEKVILFIEQNPEYQYVYIATETRYAVELFEKELGKLGIKVLTNKRVYFDQFDFKTTFLSDIKMEREKDEYWRGMEYLSSIHIVAKCDSLIAGMCGGSQMALIINDFQYEQVQLFDLGVYR